MTHLPLAIKLRIFLAACTLWLCAGVWLVGCVACDAPARMLCSAALAVVLLAVAVGFVRHELELDLLRARAIPTRVGSDDDWEKGEA